MSPRPSPSIPFCMSVTPSARCTVTPAGTIIMAQPPHSDGQFQGQFWQLRRCAGRQRVRPAPFPQDEAAGDRERGGVFRCCPALHRPDAPQQVCRLWLAESKFSARAEVNARRNVMFAGDGGDGHTPCSASSAMASFSSRLKLRRGDLDDSVKLFSEVSLLVLALRIALTGGRAAG